MASDLLLAIREVGEDIHLQEEIWHAGLCEVVAATDTGQKDPGAARLQCHLK
jgi:hypothetical protein